MRRKLLSLLGCFILSTFLFGLKAESPVKVFLKLDDYPAHPVKCNITTDVLDYIYAKKMLRTD